MLELIRMGVDYRLLPYNLLIFICFLFSLVHNFKMKKTNACWVCTQIDHQQRLDNLNKNIDAGVHSPPQFSL